MRVEVNASMFWRNARAFLDGAEVTEDCYFADEEAGVVGLYLRNDKGLRYLVDGDVARETKQGAVTIRLRDDAPSWMRRKFEELHAPAV